MENEYQEEEEKEPKLENYYTSSKEMKEYENVVFFIIGISGGYLVDKLNFF